MKIFTILFGILAISVTAFSSSLIDDIKVYQTDNRGVNIDNINRYVSHMHEINDSREMLSQKGMSYWLEFKLKDNLKADLYVGYYIGFEINETSFKEHQNFHKFSFTSLDHIEFDYDPLEDVKTYYLKITPNVLFMDSATLNIMPEKEYLAQMDHYSYVQVIIGIVIGIIFMTAVYNGAIFYFNKERVFIYYTLMQISMILLLLAYSSSMFLDILQVVMEWNKLELLAMVTTLFTILFTRDFFNTPRFTPRIDKILLVYITILIIDIIITIFYRSLILKDLFYSPFLTVLILVALIRIRQGFMPSYFYLIGWIVMLISVAMLEFEDDLIFSPMLVGSAVEAIMLSLALTYKFKLLQEENEQQRQIMIQQSKLASMGEMLGNIAHQWRQPLARLSYIFMNIGTLDSKTSIATKVCEGVKQLEFMSQTIDDFRDFYLPNGEKEIFSLSVETHSVLDILHAHLDSQHIDCIFVTKQDAKINNHKHQYAQVLLNLILNAKEAFDLCEVENPTIRVVVDGRTIRVQDNAGGISDDIADKIFEPYFTTKDSGSGIGLYMSKMIVEKNMSAILGMKSLDGGSEFWIRF